MTDYKPTTTRIPILLNHDPNAAVGKVEGNIATFLPGKVTNEMMFNAGWIILEAEEKDGVQYIRKARIVELSVGHD